MNICGRAHVARPKYIHRLTDEYTWASKLPALLFPSLCLILKRPHALNARMPPSPPPVPLAGLHHRRPCPEPASPLLVGAAPGAPGPLHRGPAPPGLSLPLAAGGLNRRPKVGPLLLFLFLGIFRYLVIFKYYLGI
jgi:hypothetical protein